MAPFFGDFRCHTPLDLSIQLFFWSTVFLARFEEMEDPRQAAKVICPLAEILLPVPGQRRAEDKSNEITAIPELPALLTIKGAIVTIDAMGCRRGICRRIIDREADYVIGLKDKKSRNFDHFSGARFRPGASLSMPCPSASLPPRTVVPSPMTPGKPARPG